MRRELLKRVLACACLSLVGCVLAAGRLSGSAAAQGAEGDKPVEQVRKNIKVLQGLPNSQLFPLMNFVSVSLGVRCDHCHVIQGKDAEGRNNWVWESDEMEEKRTAREMMRMVLAVNKGDFGLGRGQVTCYTCHQGKTHPTSMPSLPLTVSGHEPAPQPTPAAAGGPRNIIGPTVQSVYDKYVAAVGGAAALANFQTFVVKGTREASQERVWPFEATLKGADKFKMVVEVPQAGRFQQAVTGATGWVSNPRTSRAVTPKELAELKMTAELLGLVKFHPSPTMRVAGLRKVGDRDAVVVVDRPSETVSRRYFFDAQTGLLLRISTLKETVLSPIPEQVDFEDYRDVSGAKLPFVVRLSAIDTYDSFTRKITDVRPGVAVDDKTFEMPPAPSPAPPGR
ncbi:MAG TPA: c-type cytochrome [Pyrinomonadaceae bacterium]|jgi:hypothetical protein|nr:c-type cytochrome [Pyrinomonadaceae bacterium]